MLSEFIYRIRRLFRNSYLLLEITLVRKPALDVTGRGAPLAPNAVSESISRDELYTLTHFTLGVRQSHNGLVLPVACSARLCRNHDMAFARKGLKDILQKYPNDVVILSALRTPITRAYKGGLRNAYPEQMLASVCHEQHCLTRT